MEPAKQQKPYKLAAYWIGLQNCNQLGYGQVPHIVNELPRDQIWGSV